MTKLRKFRAAPAYLSLGNPRIDRDKLVIYDTVAMLANVEALGHGVQTDQKTLEMMLPLAQRFSRGVKMRFGHPGMSENAMGKHYAWARNFRIRGDKLIHDLHFMEQAAISPAYTNDPIEYTLQMAEHQPEEIGESVVIEADVVWTLDNGDEVDGDMERPESALTELPVLRPTALYFVDVVSEPALTRDGLLASMMFSGSTSSYTEQAFQLIDEFREEYRIGLDELPQKVNQVMKRYLYSRGERMSSRKRKLNFDETPAEEGVVQGVLEETTPAEAAAPAEADTQPEAADVDAAIHQAEETSAALEGEPEPEEPETEPVVTVSASQFADLLSRLEAQEQLIQQLSQKVEQVVRLESLNARNVANVTQRVLALEGEPLVTDTIGGARQFDTAALPPLSSLRMPTHVTNKVQRQHSVPTDESDPARASLQMSQQRAALIEGG